MLVDLCGVVCNTLDTLVDRRGFGTYVLVRVSEKRIDGVTVEILFGVLSRLLEMSPVIANAIVESRTSNKNFKFLIFAGIISSTCIEGCKRIGGGDR